MEDYRNISEASLVHEEPLEGHNGIVLNEVIDNNVTCEDSIGFSEDLAKCEDFMAMFATPETLPSKLFDVSGQTIETTSLQSSVKMEIADENNHNEDSKTNVLTGNFQIDKYSIPCIPKEEQDHELQGLGVCVYDQTEFEEEVMGQVDKALKREDEKRRKQEVEKELNAVSDDIRFAKLRLGHLDKALAMAPKDEKLMTNAAKREVLSIKKEQENKLKHLKKLEAKQRTLNACFTGNVEEFGQSLSNDHRGDEDMDDETRYHLQRVFTPKETEEERLIRTGQMTPFGTVISNKVKPPKIIIPQNQLTEFDKFLLGEAENHQNKKMAKLPCKTSTSKSAKTSKFTNNLKPSNSHETELTASPSKSLSSMSSIVTKPSKSVKKKIKLGSKHATGMKRKTATPTLVRNYTSDPEMSDFENGEKDDSDRDYTSDKDEEYIPDEVSSDASDKDVSKKGKFILKKGKQKCWTGPVSLKKDESFEDSSDSDNNLKKSPRKRQMKVVDDGCQKSYVKRIKLLEKSKLLQKHQKILESEDGVIDSDDENCAEFDGGFKVPSSLWNKLYSYQQTGVRWLWELHQQNCGGIVGDEMGLGKTIQMIVFLVGLKISNLHTDGDTYQGLGPVILVCPTTVMHQWVKEFFTWWPDFRVAVLHESGSFTGKKGDLVYIINKKSGILITSYAGVVLHQKQLLDCNWHYVILDEGHKIRNPDAQATLVAKQFRTQHRLILSGSPIQNNLKELWSLFDFVFPGKLGTLPVFMQQFSVPIVQGGYANASQVQVQTAYKCATILRDTIKPYLLRRMKADVKVSIQLPNKNEQVLFCQLTEDQTQLYKDYLGSAEVASIINARLQIFVGLINLRKICNHPDIFNGGPKIFKDTDISTLSEDMHFGYYKRSGKMIVVEALLRLWHQQGHRVLFFSQSRQLLNIMEKFVKSKNYTYMKMDGTTSISSRQPAIAKFNSDPNIFVFLLTTRVGGIGVNLTGADRVVIYDPDWNPSTDAQARERSWRIGQEKQVTIYRLLTAGTIEEKIYHRQIFKQFVTNRVLKDPRQRRFFKSNDLYELFTFSEMGKQGTETSAIFAGTGSEVKPVKKPKLSTNKMGKWTKRLSPPPKLKDIEVSFSSEKQEKMKSLAKKLSMQLAESRLNSYEANNNTDLNSEKKQCGSNTISSDNKNLTDVPPIISKESCSSKTKNEIANASSENTGVRKRKISLEKEKSHEKKTRKKWKSTMIEGERIKYLVKKDVFKSATETEKESVNDDYVLSKLFKKSGVHTALKHDAIVDASDPDYMLVEGEANRVAQQAVKVLKMSRRQCARAEEGIPTWTGANGGNKHKFGVKKKTSVIPNLPFSSPSASPAESSNPGPSGIIRKKSAVIGKNNNDSISKSSDDIPSSSDLLAAIKQRKVIFGNDKNSDSSDEDSVPIRTQNSSTEYDELLVDIRNFIAFQASVDGQATTDEILREFKHKLPLNQTAVFKSLLSKICDFSRRSSGDGIWILKGEFQ